MAEEKEVLSELNILDDFQWDEKDINFFGEGISKEELEKDIPKNIPKKKEKEGKEEDTFSEESEEEVNHSFEFEENEEDEESSKSKNIKTTKSKTDNNKDDVDTIESHKVVNFLMKQGIIDLDEEQLKEFEELDDVDKEEIIKDFYFKAVEDKFEEDIKNLPEIVKNSLKIAIKGGNVDEYLSSVYTSKNTGLTKNMNLEDELIQEKITKYKLIEEGYDDDYIESQIEFLKDSDKLKITAEKYYNKWKKDEEEKEKKYLKSVEEEANARRNSQIEYRKSLAQHLSTLEDIKGFKISKKEISELPEYIAVPNIKTSTNQVITGFQKDLFEAMKDKDKVILMAKILKSDFDFSILEKTLKSEQTKNLKENLQRQKENKNINSTIGSSQKQKRLVDFFD
jgi:hypothetical protein